MPTIRKYDEFPAAAALDGTEKVLIEQGGDSVLASVAAIAGAGTPPANSVNTAAIQNNAVTNAKLAQVPANSLIANLTSALANADYVTTTQLEQALAKVRTQSLCPIIETAQQTGLTCLVDIGVAPASNIVGLGTSGQYFIIDFAGGTITAGTISGGYGSDQFVAAIYDATKGRIYAINATGTKLVSINPNTWAGTTIYDGSTFALLPFIVAIPNYAQFVVARTGVNSIDLYSTSSETAVSYSPLSGSQTWKSIGYDSTSDCVYGLIDDGVVSTGRIMRRIPRSTFNTSTSGSTTSAPAASGNTVRSTLVCQGGKAYYGRINQPLGEMWDISGSSPAYSYTIAGRFSGGAILAAHPNGFVYMLGAKQQSAVFKCDPTTPTLYAIAQAIILSGWSATADTTGSVLIAGNDGYLYLICKGSATNPTVMKVLP